MPETRKVEIRKQTRLFDDFFKVDEILVAHEQRDGTLAVRREALQQCPTPPFHPRYTLPAPGAR
jgi:hypothetical protein